MKHKLLESGIFNGYVDIHSHMLCGVDDGALRVSESERMISRFSELGAKKCILTPHIQRRMYNNSVEKLQNRFTQSIAPLSQKYDIELALAAEYMMDDGLKSRYENGDKLLTLKDNKVLVELPMSWEYSGWEDEIKDLNSAGYQVVLAHPERYFYVSLQKFQRLKEQGTLLQLNFLSLQGFYGVRVQDNARRLIRTGIFDLVASDIHYDSMLTDIEELTVNQDTFDILSALVENNKAIFG